MKKDFHDIKKEFQSIIKSNTLENLKLFQINNHYYDFSKENYWIIDGGIEFNFGSKLFSFAWSQKTDSFSFENKRFSEVYTENNYVELNLNFITDIRHKKISNVLFKFIDYHKIIDYRITPEKEAKLVGIEMEYESNRKITFSAITYELDHKNKPTLYTYDVSGELLISMNHKMNIT